MIRTLKDINWNQVYCFYKVARKLSMKEAGKILHISTPTVSEQIKKLENILGVKLFKRQPRKLSLTREGESLFHCAKEMFDVGGRFLDTISPNSIGGYAVRVGIQESISSSLAINFVSQYWDLYAPYGTVNTVREIYGERLTEKILTNECDWGITLEKPKSLKLNYGEIGSINIVFCCSPRIFRKFKNKEGIVRTIPLARSSWDKRTNQAVDDYLRELNIFPDEIIETDHRDFSVGLAHRGRCVTVLDENDLKQSGWRDRVKCFSLGKPIEIKLYAYWAKATERMISISRLRELLNMDGKPREMEDPELQIRVSDVPPEKLVKD